MNTLDCQFLRANNGWHCQPMEGRGEETLYVSSPILLADGKPIDFYLIRRGSNLVFTDDGLTLFALRNYGLELDSKRNWKGLEAIAEGFGFKLDDDGSINALFPEARLAWWMNRVLRLFCGIAEWQKERFDQDDVDFGLTEEVERLLRLKAPNRPLKTNPRVKLKGVDYAFDFQWGDTLVDAIAPSAQSVSARLRKAILATQGSEELNLLFILDDRFDRDRADRELPVLGAVAQTILLTDFAEHYQVLQE